MTVTVLDSTDLTGILADAGVTLDQPTDKVVEDDPSKDAKTEVNTEKVDPQVDPDDVEGDDGLTPRQKKELTSSMQKAIGKKHRMQREAEEFAAAEYNQRRLAEQRAENLEKQLAALKQGSAPEKVENTAPVPPNRQNFATENDWVDAMIQYGVDKRLAEKAEEDRAAAQKREYDERIETAKGRILKAIELVPDFEEVIMGNDATLSPAIGTYLEESEMVAELTYHFAKNPDLLASLMKLSPHAQLVKIGKIESTLTPFGGSTQTEHDGKSSKEASNGKVPKTEPSTNTGIDLSKPRSKPAPVFAPLDGSGSAGASKDSKDMNIRESIEDFAKRNRVNLGSRKRH